MRFDTAPESLFQTYLWFAASVGNRASGCTDVNLKSRPAANVNNVSQMKELLTGPTIKGELVSILCAGKIYWDQEQK